MSCDITSFAEVKNKRSGVWEKVYNKFSLDDYDKKKKNKDKGDSPFYEQSYSLFGFLANVRNYDECEPLSLPKGIPDDCNIDIFTDYECERFSAHSSSYLTLRELVQFDYDKIFWNRRIEREIAPNQFDCTARAEEGEGKMISYRDNLPDLFFIHLEELKQLGDLDDVRIIFWFNS